MKHCSIPINAGCTSNTISDNLKPFDSSLLCGRAYFIDNLSLFLESKRRKNAFVFEIILIQEENE